VRIASVLGKRSTQDLAPGETWRQTFAARSTSLAAGTVTVTASGVATKHAYPALTCD
jgi:hypothetical protein